MPAQDNAPLEFLDDALALMRQGRFQQLIDVCDESNADDSAYLVGQAAKKMAQADLGEMYEAMLWIDGRGIDGEKMDAWPMAIASWSRSYCLIQKGDFSSR